VKKQVPIFITLVVGFFATLEFYLPYSGVSSVQETLLRFGQVLAASAFVLGGVNVIQVNYPIIRRRGADWPFKLLLLCSAVAMGLVGVKWHEVGGKPANGYVRAGAIGERACEMPDPKAKKPGKKVACGYIRVEAGREDAQVKLDGDAPVVNGKPHPSAWAGDQHLVLKVPVGKHKVDVSVELAGYGKFESEFHVEAGQTIALNTDLVMLWGPTGRVYTWIYDHVFAPCNATMFALLAFFIASAAFRAFRARNTEAALLLGAAILIMLGRVPFGRAISASLPEVADWIIDVPNNAGRRAIIMGAALGAIATGLRVIVGLERSHLGAGE